MILLNAKFILFLFLFPTVLFAQGSGHTLTFNGSNEAINLGDEVINNCRTIEFWFKPYATIDASTSRRISLISRDYNSGSAASRNEMNILLLPSSSANPGQLAFVRWVGSQPYRIFSDQNRWEADHWYHIAATIDPTSGMKMYVNGVLQESRNSSTEPIGAESGSNTDIVAIGKWGSLNRRYFQGEIDEVRIWESVRLQSEIRENMCSKINRNDIQLRAYYPFDSINGSQLIDQSLHSHHGSLLNMDNSNWIYSGAPIGDTSNYVYDNISLFNRSVGINSIQGDLAIVENIKSNAKGVHIYSVNAKPNSTQNLNRLSLDSYVGVFLTDISGSFDLTYNYSGSNCDSSCDALFARNDNSILQWSPVSTVPNNCIVSAPNESTVDYDYRSEYIVSRNKIDLDIGDDTIACSSDPLVLETNQQFDSYLWSDSTTHSSLEVHEAGTYWVRVSKNNCRLSDTVNVVFKDCNCNIYIPNTFTPNNDNINDTFSPVLNCQITDYSLMVFSRWGELIYESHNYEKGWNGEHIGKDVSPGVYIYIIKYKSLGSEYHQISGTISLFR